MGGQSSTAERWRVDPNNNCDIQSEDGTREIASTHPGLLKGGFCDPSTAQGYARLIAAAPDLLEADEEGAAALIALIERYERVDASEEDRALINRASKAYAALNAAIAKATGESA